MHILWAPARVMRRLWSLVRDEDHDSWLDDHKGGPPQGPDTGKTVRGGFSIGGGGS
jgi:hypothetical protein